VTRQPDAEEITLNTIRQWAERETRFDAPPPGTHAAGRRAAARDVLAILGMHGRPAGEPVIFGSSLEA